MPSNAVGWWQSMLTIRCTGCGAEMDIRESAFEGIDPCEADGCEGGEWEITARFTDGDTW